MSLAIWGLPIIEVVLTYRVEPERPLKVREHTSSISKLLLAKTVGDPLKRLIARRARAPPKPIRISVPLTPQGKPITPMLISNKKPRPNDIPPITINKGTYKIALAAPQTLISRILTNIESNEEEASYKGVKINYKILNIEIAKAYPEEPQEEPSQDITGLQVTLETPTIPKDPIIKGKYAPFTNTPDVILSIPAYFTAKTIGAKHTKTLQTLRKCLIPPHTAHCKLKKTWYTKKTRKGQATLPSLTGTIRYLFNKYQCSQIEARTIQQIAAIAEILGTGRGRASGFGQTKTLITKLE